VMPAVARRDKNVGVVVGQGTNVYHVALYVASPDGRKHGESRIALSADMIIPEQAHRALKVGRHIPELHTHLSRRLKSRREKITVHTRTY
jgi:hypothetical protein